MGFRLKDFRQAHKLYQSDMAELLQENQSSISRKELRKSCKLTYPQMQILYEKYGKEDVESFLDDNTEDINLEVSGNTNEGGTQNNGYFGVDAVSMSIIKQQSDALIKLSAKQAEQTDKLLALIEKLQEKL